MRLRCTIAAMILLPAAAWAYEPTSNYTVQTVEGWKVYVNNTLLAGEKALGAQCLRLLEDHLYRVGRVVPAGPLKELKKVPVWLELKGQGAGACYHPSRRWLEGHDHNPEKAKSVEISNARNFLAWSHQQPWMMLHELAHAYHHQVLGHGQKDIRQAFGNAVKKKTYEAVLHCNGSTVKHYALSNDQEYIAEMTECFFGTNDFYPFVRAELQQCDPGMYAVLKELWQVERPKKAAARKEPVGGK